jgi:Ran GTPase-activating protein (RanGAP) involved in mRNA processing and transport
LSGNHLGPKGAAVLAPAIAVCTSLTSLIIRSNHLGDEGMGAIAIALKDSTVSKLASLDVCNNKIGPKGAEALAAWLAVCASITEVC